MHFWKDTDKHILKDVHFEQGPPIKLPDATTIQANQVGYIPVQGKLSKTARKARILKDLKSANLISLGQLADNGCTTNIDNKKLTVTKQDDVVLTGTRNSKDGLYDIPIFANHPNPKTLIQENNYRLPKIHNIQAKSISPHKSESHPRTLKQLVKHKRNQYDINNISSKCLDTLIDHTKQQDQK